LKLSADGFSQRDAQKLDVIGIILDEQQFDSFDFHVLRGPTRIHTFLPSLGGGGKFLLRAGDRWRASRPVS
jgi:hypothetical protein